MKFNKATLVATAAAMSLGLAACDSAAENEAEEKAARLPAVMTVPLIIFILPTLFVVLMGPATCQINDKFINGGI